MHLTISTGIYWGLTIHEPLFWEQWIQPWGNRTPRIPLHGGRETIWKINLSASSEDEKEKEAAQGDGEWRKESTLGCEASAQRGLWADLGGGGAGAQADLERLLLTEGGASAGATGRCPRGSGQGAQESRVRMRGVRAETEQETGVTASKGVRGRGGGTWSEVFKESLLCFAINRQ